MTQLFPTVSMKIPAVFPKHILSTLRTFQLDSGQFLSLLVQRNFSGVAVTKSEISTFGLAQLSLSQILHNTVDGRNPAPLGNNGTPLLLGICGESSFEGFLGGAGFCPMRFLENFGVSLSQPGQRDLI